MKRATALGIGVGAVVGLGAVALAAPGDITRVSVTTAGAESPSGGFRGVTAGDGRYVMFVSGSDLTTTPGGGKAQLYVRDRVAGATRLVSASPTGVAANAPVEFGDAFNPPFDITPDGRFAVFASAATNLGPSGLPGTVQVFRKDLTTGDVVLVSVNSAGTVANAGVGGDPSLSGDGTRVVFTTGAATNLVATDANGGGASDVVVRDIPAATTALVSSNSAGQQANEFTERPNISADGRVVVFEAGPVTDNLFTDDTNANSDIIVKNLATGVAQPAAVVSGTTRSGANVKGGNIPDISGDGRYVVFQTSAVLDAATDTNMETDVYRHDMVAGTTVLLSARNGLVGNGNADATAVRISADGARAAFLSNSTDLVTGDANGAADAFARTVSTTSTVRISQRADGTASANGAETAGIADNGGLGVFTGQGDYATEATNGDDDVFATELVATDTTAPAVTATRSAAGVVSGTVAADPSGTAAITIDGVTVRPAADGTFSHTVAATGPAATLRVMDGAGNVATQTLAGPAIPTPTTPTKTSPLGVTNPPPTARPVRLVRTVSARLTARHAAVRFTAATGSRVSLQLLRRVRVGTAFRDLRIGRSRLVVGRGSPQTVLLPRLRGAGVYRVRITVRLGEARAAIVVAPKR